MSCDYHRRQLFLYLDGELPSSEIAATQTHLADCDRCRQTYRTQVRLDSLYHQIHENNDGDFADQVLARLEIQTGCPRRWPWRKIAVAVVIFILGTSFGNLTGKEWAKNRPTPIVDRPSPVQQKIQDKDYPYLIKVDKASGRSYLVIHNSTEEKRWQQFLQSYVEQIQSKERQQRLNRYNINAIPASLIHHGNF